MNNKDQDSVKKDDDTIDKDDALQDSEEEEGSPIAESIAGEEDPGSVLEELSCNWIIALGSSDPDVIIPRGLWYLKLLPTRWIPFANRADASVSPLKPKYVLLLNLNDTL